METLFVQELNYLRLNDLIQTNAQPVVKIVFDKYFLSHRHGQLSKILSLYIVDLEEMKLQGIILPHQWICLFPFVGNPISDSFDISLMMSLLEYIVFKNGSDGEAFALLSTDLQQPMNMRYSGGFPWLVSEGFDKRLPPNNDVSVRADIRRIKWIRIYMENIWRKKMSNKDFQYYWKKISGALERLGESKNIELRGAMNVGRIGCPFAGISTRTKDELKTALLEGSYSSHENRVYLVGPSKSGKTSLACILIGNDIPKTWNSTNGLFIYYGQNGIHMITKTMYPLSVNIDIDMETDIAPCDIIDFGGQDAFDMIHQLFISQRGTFCFMFDGRNNLNDILEDQKRTTADLLIHWINLILTYCNSQNRGFPKIVLAATHRDKILTDDIEQRRAELVAQIDNVLGLHPLRHHIMYDELVFLNTQSKDDNEVESLKKILVGIAFSQPTWGEKLPKKWRHLQRSLAALKGKGRKIIERKEVEKINEENAEATLDSNGLNSFLKIQHALGKIMYFDSGFLRELVIVDPFYMVIVLRSFVTDVRFWPEEKEYRNIHQTLQDTGILKKADLFRLWEQQDVELLWPHRKQIAEILVHLDVLVQPKEYSKEYQNETACDYFFVPCMVQKTDSTNYMRDNCTSDRSISLTYKCTSSIVLPAFAFRLFGACLSMWECKDYEERKMLFLDSVVLSFEKDTDVYIRVCGSRINIYLIHSKRKEFIEWNIATGIQECVTDSLEKILLFYEGTFGGSIRFQQNMQLSLFNFEFKLKCGMKECHAPEFVRHFTPESRWICENNKTHDVRWLLLWFPCKISSDVDSSQYQGPEPAMPVTESVSSFKRFSDVYPSCKKLARLFDKCEFDKEKTHCHTISFKEATERLRTAVENSLSDVEIIGGRKVSEFRIGKASVTSQEYQTFDPMKPMTWGEDGGTIEKWWVRQKDNYDGLFEVGCVTNELIPKVIKETNTAIRMDHQMYALVMAQALVHHYMVHEPDARLRNKSISIGNWSEGKRGDKGGIIYVAYKLESGNEVDGLVIKEEEQDPEESTRRPNLIPTDQQLRRFAIQFTNSDFRNLMINLEMGIPRIEQIFYEHRHLHDAMFYCLWNWRGSAINPSFSALKTALETSHLTSDYLLKAFEMSTVVEGVPTYFQDLEPTEPFLIKLSRVIGKEVFQLTIELELKVSDYEDIDYNYDYKNLPEQSYAVLRKWKQSRNSPTVKQLVNAMSRINKDVKYIVKVLEEYYSITKM